MRVPGTAEIFTIAVITGNDDEVSSGIERFEEAGEQFIDVCENLLCVVHIRTMAQMICAEIFECRQVMPFGQAREVVAGLAGCNRRQIGYGLAPTLQRDKRRQRLPPSQIVYSAQLESGRQCRLCHRRAACSSAAEPREVERWKGICQRHRPTGMLYTGK